MSTFMTLIVIVQIESKYKKVTINTIKLTNNNYTITIHGQWV